MVWRWMKVALSGGFKKRLALRLRRLDVIAEKVVVLDPELPDSGLLGVRGLHLGDDAAAFVAKAARFVERRGRARADEAAVALEQRQILRQRRSKIMFEPAAVATEEGAIAQKLGRQVVGRLEQAQERARGG